MTPTHKDNMASPAQAPASEASPKGLVSTSPSCIWPQSIAASCGFWNKPQKRETAFYSEGREEDREPHFGFAHKSISTATNMFRIVDRKNRSMVLELMETIFLGIAIPLSVYWKSSVLSPSWLKENTLDSRSHVSHVRSVEIQQPVYKDRRVWMAASFTSRSYHLLSPAFPCDFPSHILQFFLTCYVSQETPFRYISHEIHTCSSHLGFTIPVAFSCLSKQMLWPWGLSAVFYQEKNHTLWDSN